jgi:hypothetical protein
MTDRIERLVAIDLASLGEDSRRDPLPIEALTSAGVYRDDRPGAEARRNALAEERRVELALMPLTLAHVFAHRVGRAAAGATGVVCAALMFLLMADPLMLELVRWFVPGLGLNLGMCVMIAATAILLAYVIATWIGESWFHRRMRAAIETRGEAYGDLDHLARGPIEVARALVRRVDGWSIGLVLAGAATLAAVFGFLAVVAGTFRPFSYVLSATTIFREPAATSNLGPVIYAIGLALVAAIIIGLACDREHRFPGTPQATRWFGHWSMLPLGVLIGLVTMHLTFGMVHRLYTFGGLPPRGQLPSSELRFGLAIGGMAAVLLLLSWAVLWWRRRERARIGDT